MNLFLSVCKNLIQHNNKIIRENRDDPLLPPIRIQYGKTKRKVTCNSAELLDGWGNVVGRIYYHADKAIIKAGAKVVIEYYHEIKVVD